MIDITAQMRVLVAIEAVDGRNYAPSMNMRTHIGRNSDLQALPDSPGSMVRIHYA
jgi:hypothetical protein